MKLSVIAPTYNEADNIVPLIQELETVLHGLDYEIVITDDNSPDQTWAIAQKIASINPHIRVLRRMSNRGLGSSVIDGFSVATGDVIACMDADLQHDPAILPAMLKSLVDGSDLVVGSRYVAGGSMGEWRWLRRIESRIATWMARWGVGIALCDPMSGYFMMRRDDFLRIRDNLNGRGFKILLEIAAALKPTHTCEVPYTFRIRVAGESKLSSKVVWAYLVQLFRLSRLGRLFPAEFIKFAIVGASGVIVNLGVMAAILHSTSYRDWRASALSSLAATVSNYVVNNSWTFRDRAHTGMTLVSRYIYYLLASLLGLAVTTGTFAVISWVIPRALRLTTGSELHTAVLLFLQLVAISAGTFSNYWLNRAITWPSNKVGQDVESPLAVRLPVDASSLPADWISSRNSEPGAPGSLPKA